MSKKNLIKFFYGWKIYQMYGRCRWSAGYTHEGNNAFDPLFAYNSPMELEL